MAKANAPRGQIRKLFATDLPLFQDHLLRLDAETRQNRFIGGVGDAFLVDYAERCFKRGGVVFGFLEDGLVRGAAELTPSDATGERRAEAAFSVEPAFRRKRLGTALFERLITTARNRGIRHVRVNCLAHNRPMQALAKKFRAELAQDRWEMVGDIDTKAPTPFTWLTEAADDTRGFLTAAIGLQRRIWLAPQGA